MISRRMLPTVVALLFALVAWRSAGAQDDTRGGLTPPRLRFTDGEVSFWRTGAEEWSAAQVNTALAAGDSVYAGDGANLEIQIGARAFVRAGSATQIDLTALEPGYTQFGITGGHAALDLATLPPGQSIEVDSPHGAFTINRPGYYRVDVDEDETEFSAGHGGRATVVSAAGEATDVGDNRRIILAGTDTVQIRMAAASAPDEWDRWNYDRTAQLGERSLSAQYVRPEIAGADDLDRYGDWREQQRYGHVWVPRGVRADWAPYSTGRWVYDPFYQWTWVDDAPWGWAPYHYGRWVHFGGVWGWVPGPVVVAPVYSPALVTFFGVPGIGVSVRVGLPFVSWCALGFGEPIIPWWGRPGFVGRPYWGGWGGPRVVNNVVIKNKTIINVTNITTYQNVHVRNAVVATDRKQFGRGGAQHTSRLDAQQVQQLKPLRGDLRVRPVAASLTPREARGQRPPDRLRTRQVVTTRPPQDTTRPVRAKGIEVKASEMPPQPRVVQAHRLRNADVAHPQAGVRAKKPATVGKLPTEPRRQSRPSTAGEPGQREPRRDQAAPQQPPQPQVPRQERAAPQQPSQPRVRQERAAPQQPPPPQAPPLERAAPHQPSQPHAPRQERAAPHDPSQRQAPPPEPAAAHELSAPKQADPRRSSRDGQAPVDPAPVDPAPGNPRELR